MPSSGPGTIAEEGTSAQEDTPNQPQDIDSSNTSGCPSAANRNTSSTTPTNRPRSSRSSPDADLLGTDALEQLRLSQRERRAFDRAEKLFEERLNSLRAREAAAKETEERLTRWSQSLAEQEAAGAQEKPSETDAEDRPKEGEGDAVSSSGSFQTATTREQAVPEVKTETAEKPIPTEKPSKQPSGASAYWAKYDELRSNFSGPPGLDSWSETASLFADRNKYKQKFEREIPPLAVENSANSGLPYTNVPSLSACGLLSREVADTLYLRGVDIKSSSCILRYFTRHLRQFEKLEKRRMLVNLKTKLKWVSTNKNPIEQIYHFFDEVLKLLKHLSPEERKKPQKRIIKTILEKLPTSFDITYDELTMLGRDVDIAELKSILLSRWFVLEKKSSKQEGTMKLIPGRKDKKYNRNKAKEMPMIAYRIKVFRIGGEAKDISLMAFDAKTKEYVQVHHLADTGADRNITSLKAIRRFALKEEDPLFVKEVEFSDKTVKKVAKTVKMLRRSLLFLKEGFKMNFGHQRNNDVHLEVDDVNTLLKTIISEMLNGQDVKYKVHVSSQKAKVPKKSQPVVRKVNAIPIEEVNTHHFVKPEENNPVNILPIAITNVVDNIPEELNEFGIGEGNIFESQERELIDEMINQKLDESIFNQDQKKEIEKLIRKYPKSWGLKQSNARMNLLNPIHVDLKPGYKILRSDGYHQSPEAEEFLELKFKSLQEAGIVERSTNPVWGHPVFVVPKKMKTPQGWLDYSEEEKEK
eukprot:augustus_masked-scaffold_46-processed-gene-0.2-mRNA-1 protein AED:1.00 eAED:1.00 QI:0/0/0/0/1/1/3/0/752